MITEYMAGEESHIKDKAVGKLAGEESCHKDKTPGEMRERKEAGDIQQEILGGRKIVNELCWK